MTPTPQFQAPGLTTQRGPATQLATAEAALFTPGHMRNAVIRYFAGDAEAANRMIVNTVLGIASGAADAKGNRPGPAVRLKAVKTLVDLSKDPPSKPNEYGIPSNGGGPVTLAELLAAAARGGAQGAAGAILNAPAAPAPPAATEPKQGQ